MHNTQIIAVLDEDVLALDRAAFQRARVNAKMTRHDVTREEDILDEVTGEAAWIADDLVVTVPLERLDAFRAWVSSRGMAPAGSDAYAVEPLTTRALGYRDVLEAVKG